MNAASQKPVAARHHERHLQEDVAFKSERSAASECSCSSNNCSSHDVEAHACFSEDSDSFDDDYPGRRKKAAVATKKPTAKKITAKKPSTKASKFTKAQTQKYLRFDSSNNVDEYAVK